MPTSSRKTILYGTRGPFSATVLRRLVADKISISHIFCAGAAPAPQPEEILPVSHPVHDRTFDTLAAQYNIPVSYIPHAAELQLVNLSQLDRPDYILAACFPYRIPEAISRWPRIAGLNLHPSLLPRYRGPDPIFWQLKNDEAHSGISLHVLSADFDQGPVVRQKPVDFAEGAYKKDIETILGQEGAALFSSLVKEGLSISTMTQQQDEASSSYYPMPTRDDYHLSPQWSARHAFNFIRGTWPPLGQHSLTITGKTWIITQAVNYSNEGVIEETVKNINQELCIQFSPGILRAYAQEA